MIHWSTALCILVTVWFGLRSFSKLFDGPIERDDHLEVAKRLVAFLLRWHIVTAFWLTYFIYW